MVIRKRANRSVSMVIDENYKKKISYRCFIDPRNDLQKTSLKSQTVLAAFLTKMKKKKKRQTA